MLRKRPLGEGDGQRQAMSLSALVTLVAMMLALPLLPLAAAASNRGEYASPDVQDKALGIDQKWPAVALTAQTHQRLNIETPKLVGRSTHPYPLQKQQIKNNAGAGRKVGAGLRNNNNNPQTPHDVRALTTLAPAPAVRAPTLQADVSLPQAATRRLAEWAVEEFVLLATVDGGLHAMERRSGRQMWHIVGEPPMVHTVHHSASDYNNDDDFEGIVWAVEPSGDGSIYIWNSNAGVGLIRTGFSMKQLVEQMAGYKSEGPAVVYTGSKQTVMLTIDAATGNVLKRFGNSIYHVTDQAESCSRPTSLYGQAATECMGTITLGRTEYTVEVQRYDGRPIATLKYSEWVPNSFDRDLLRQYEARLESFDHQYILTGVDGSLSAWDYSRPDDGEHFVYDAQYGATIGRVFDVFRPAGSEAQSNRELVILPHPSPNRDISDAIFNMVYLNQTMFGGWYALSGPSYPLVLDSPLSIAEHSPPGFRRRRMAPDFLIGRHIIDGDGVGGRYDGYHVALLPAPEIPTNAPDIGGGHITSPPMPPSSYDSAANQHGHQQSQLTVMDRVQSLPREAAVKVLDWCANPLLHIIAIVFVFRKQQNIRRWYKSLGNNDAEDDEGAANTEDDGQDGGSSSAASENSPTAEVTDDKFAVSLEGQPPLAAKKEFEDSEKAADVPATTNDDNATTDNNANGNNTNDNTTNDNITNNDCAQDQTNQQPAKGSPELEPSAPSNPPAPPDPSATTEQPLEKPKKKAHRGRRSGVAHRKKKKLAEQEANDGSNPDAVEEAVNNAKKMVTVDTGLQPDVQTVSHDMKDVGAGILRLGNMEVDMNTQLGTGSNGTLVFAGTFNGRDVAVKRMLVQFYDIASQETKLLKESDDHPNVIRYFEQQVMQSFLYIALERCAASLADVIEKPHLYRDIATAGEQDMREVLRQIANGICHLHELRIVHRDLKPHNILVKMDKNGKPCLKVSDFGLCKKLENTQSSFGATTGRAAGTCGWRAPELLLDDDSPHSLQPTTNPGGMDGASSDGGSGSLHVGMPGDPHQPSSGRRRATRSIDIFSLGLVFFYVLTRGHHPFDCGDRYMREVNIRKGNYNLDDLEVLGPGIAIEARDLVSKMIRPNPKDRITAPDVLAHPFFWDAKKRLNFLCDVSDGFEKEQRDPPSPALEILEKYADEVTFGDFLKRLPAPFVDSLGKQRKYRGEKLLDLLRALRNKKNHYEDLEPHLKRMVGGLWDGGYLDFWTSRFPVLLLACWDVVCLTGWAENDRFREYYAP